MHNKCIFFKALLITLKKLSSFLLKEQLKRAQPTQNTMYMRHENYVMRYMTLLLVLKSFDKSMQ
jgi:hypothetical protein